MHVLAVCNVRQRGNPECYTSAKFCYRLNLQKKKAGGNVNLLKIITLGKAYKWKGFSLKQKFFIAILNELIRFYPHLLLFYMLKWSNELSVQNFPCTFLHGSSQSLSHSDF